jgi:tRNA(Ile)-lysidine synthase
MKVKNLKQSMEQVVLRQLRSLGCDNQKVLVGCSGGIDSIVMLEVLFRLRNLLNLELIVAYVHHGRGKNSRYRGKAATLVQKFAEKRALPFVTNASQKAPRLTSEARFRDWRWSLLKKWREELDCDAIAVAHHYQDLLETRMIRMIRGTGAQGFTSMVPFEKRNSILRPLLMVEKTQIKTYARSRSLDFLEDPSNAKLDPLRNWLRGWLAQLDKRQSNGTRNLARSLQQLAEHLESFTSGDEKTIMTNGGINRRLYLRTGFSTRKTSLARYCFELGLKNYTQGHIEELVKRLDGRKKEYTFELLQCVWKVTPDQIRASRANTDV